LAQLAEADIYLGSGRMVGRLSVDAGMIRSESGPLEPRLVVPLRIEMNSRSGDQMLVVTWLTARLHFGDENSQATQVGLPTRIDLVPSFTHAPFRTDPTGSTRSCVFNCHHYPCIG
jgi:hypothetical protein